MPVDPKTLPQDAETLKKMLVDVTAQLDRTERLLRQLLTTKTGRKSEQLSREQLALFACELGLNVPEPEESDDSDEEPPSASASGSAKPHGRKALPRHLKRERIEHDLSETEKHCAHCDQDLRRIGEEVSERYEYIPAQMKVIEDACFTYACVCTVKTAAKPVQPIEKSTAGASLLAQVIVAKYADHLPLHRQAKMFARHGVELSDQTLCGWTAQCAQLLEPLYQRLKRHVLASKVVGTDDTPVKVLDRKLAQARKGRIWPYVGDGDHVAAVYDYTPTRERAGPEECRSAAWWKWAAGRTRAGIFIKGWKATLRVCAPCCCSSPNCMAWKERRGHADYSVRNYGCCVNMDHGRYWKNSTPIYWRFRISSCLKAKPAKRWLML